MLDIFTKILSSVVSQIKPNNDNLGKIEKELARKFDALEARTRKDNATRWLFLLFVCALIGLGVFIGYRQAKKEVKVMIGERLDKEFSSAYLQQTIEDSAKKYTEVQLKSYVDNQLAAHYKVSKLEAMARQDSRKAYEELLTLADSAQFKDEAQFSLSIVRKRFESLVYPFEPAPSAVETAEGSSTTLKLDPLKISESSIDALRPRLIQLAQESQKNYLVPDFIRFLRESDSLGASVGICRILAHNYGNQAGDYEFGKWIQYLETLDKNSVKLATISK